MDSALYAGYEIPPLCDSMISKLIIRGANREEAIARSRRALSQYRIEDVKTTIPLTSTKKRSYRANTTPGIWKNF